MTLVLKVDDLGTVPSTVPMSSMSKPAPLDPAQFSLSRHGHPVQNGGIFFVSKSLGEGETQFAAVMAQKVFYLLTEATCIQCNAMNEKNRHQQCFTVSLYCCHYLSACDTLLL